MTREPISKKLRFEVFKRDGFTCQYCGRKAPDVILHVDHIAPVAKGGKNDLLNLVTSCADCNHGKGARELSDDSVVEKQRKQLETLQERRDQIEMMLEWKASLLDIETEQARGAASYWEKLVPGWAVSADGVSDIKKWVSKFGLDEVIESMKISAETYIEIADGRATDQSWNNAFDKVPRICSVRKTDQFSPELSELYYIRGILRNRFRGCNQSYAIRQLRAAYGLGAAVESMKLMALRIESWNDWIDDMEILISTLERSRENGGGSHA